MSEREEKIVKYRIYNKKDVSVVMSSQKEWDSYDGCDAKWLHDFIGDFMTKNPIADEYRFILLDEGYNGTTLEAYGVPKTDKEIDEEIAKIEGYAEKERQKKEEKDRKKKESKRELYLRLKKEFEGIE